MSAWPAPGLLTIRLLSEKARSRVYSISLENLAHFVGSEWKMRWSMVPRRVDMVLYAEQSGVALFTLSLYDLSRRHDNTRKSADAVMDQDLFRYASVLYYFAATKKPQVTGVVQTIKSPLMSANNNEVVPAKDL